MKILTTFSNYRSSSRYPWNEWADGQIRALEHGVDFHCKPRSFHTIAMARAKKMGKTLHARVRETTVEIQFTRENEAAS